MPENLSLKFEGLPEMVYWERTVRYPVNWELIIEYRWNKVIEARRQNNNRLACCMDNANESEIGVIVLPGAFPFMIAQAMKESLTHYDINKWWI